MAFAGSRRDRRGEVEVEAVGGEGRRDAPGPRPAAAAVPAPISLFAPPGRGSRARATASSRSRPPGRRLRPPRSPAAAAGRRLSRLTWGWATLRAPPVSWSRSNRMTPPSPDLASAVRTHGASVNSLLRTRPPSAPRSGDRGRPPAVGEAADDGPSDGSGDVAGATGDVDRVAPAEGASADDVVGGPHAARNSATPPKRPAARRAEEDGSGRWSVACSARPSQRAYPTRMPPPGPEWSAGLTGNSDSS